MPSLPTDLRLRGSFSFWVGATGKADALKACGFFTQLS
jgi:hypothetical protein